MSREEELVEIIDKTFPFPPRVIAGYAKLEQAFTSGDLARVCGISRSSAKFYLGKMVDLRMVLRDLIKLAVIPLETGVLKVPDEG